MIHCGVASRFRGGVRIEQRGRRSGYISAGSDGLPAPKDGVENWAGGKEEEDELWTTVDAKGCRDWLEKEMGVEVSFESVFQFEGKDIKSDTA